MGENECLRYIVLTGDNAGRGRRGQGGLAVQIPGDHAAKSAFPLYSGWRLLYWREKVHRMRRKKNSGEFRDVEDLMWRSPSSDTSGVVSFTQGLSSKPPTRSKPHRESVSTYPRMFTKDGRKHSSVIWYCGRKGARPETEEPKKKKTRAGPPEGEDPTQTAGNCMYVKRGRRSRVGCF